MKPKLKIFKNKENLFQDGAEYISGLMQAAIRERDACAMLLAGGSTPEGLYRALASPPHTSAIAWEKVFLFWGDERCVPPDHRDSNYLMTKRTLLEKINIPDRNILRIPAEKEPAVAASEYETTMRKFFGDPAGYPVFDIVLLGIGEDGHTASIFPDTKGVDEHVRWVSDIYVPRAKTYRITVTLPVINNARRIVFLVSGAAKADIVQKIYDRTNLAYPASLVAPVHGELIYLADMDAGKNIDIT